MVSPSQRQSTELLRKAVDVMNALEWPVPPSMQSLTRIELVNGARILSLPSSEETIRGLSSPDLVLIDEASRVSSELAHACRPMLSVGHGRLVAVSTPWIKAGWFWESWTSGESWQRFKVTADQCPRITPEFLDGERRELPDRIYRREYFCEFAESEGSVFRAEDIAAALADTSVMPLQL